MSKSKDILLFPMTSIILAGLWRLDLPKMSKIPSKLLSVIYKGYAVFMQTFMFSYLMRIVASTYVLWKVDPGAAFLDFAKILMETQLCIKAIIYQLRSFTLLIEKVRKDVAVLYETGTPEHIAIYEEHVKIVNRVGKMICVTMGIITGGITQTGIVLNQEYNTILKNGTIPDDDMPIFSFYAWYPFPDSERHLHLKLILLDSSTHVYVMSFLVTTSNLASNALLIFMRAQLKILQRRFQDFCDDDPEKTHNNLKEICERHQQVISYILDGFNTLKHIVFLEFYTCALIMACAAIIMIQGESIEFHIGIIYLVWSGLLLSAWYANEVTVESVELSQAIYNSNWYDQDSKVKSTIKTVMLRCQSPLKLPIGHFRPISLDDPIATIKLTYSFTSLMMAQEFTT